MLNNPNFPSDSGMEEKKAQLIERLRQAKTEAQRVALVRGAVENARNAIAQDVLSKMKDEISVNNLDEVKLHLRNELDRFSKPLLKMLKEFSISADKIEQIEEDMEKKANSAFDDSFQTVIVRKPKEHFLIDNLGEIQFPTDVSINNLESLEDKVDKLGQVIRDTFNVDIPTPQVHVEAPIVTVNPAPVNIDATDLSPIVDALEPLKLLSNDPTKPIAVRMSDGEEYVDLLKDIANNTSQPIMMSGGYPEVAITNTARNPVPITGTISVDTTGLATSAKQDTQTTALQLIDDPVATTGSAIPTKGFAVSGTDGTNARVLKTDSSGELQVDVLSSALPTGAATAALQTQPGVDIGDVTVNNASGASAVNIQDGGNIISIDDGGGSITVDGALNTTFPSGATDIFGMLKMSQQNNQIDIQFYRDTPQNLTTITTANSGTAVSSSGGALFSTGTNANGGVKSVTYTNVTYRGGSEIYAYFTASFSAAGLANTYIRMGLYDTNNGAFIGFEGTSFYASHRNNGVDTQTVSGSFNGDTLTGGVGSNFKRGGSAEAVDFTKLNVYRIRLGWVGGAPIKYEILSPDGEWVTFHTLRFPNTSSTPSIRSADLPFTLDLQKTGAAGTNIQVNTGCWACGNTYHPSDQFVIGQGSQTALNQNIVLDVAGTASFDCYQFNSLSLEVVPASGTVTAGAITFEGSNDNVNFVATSLYDDASPRAMPVSTYTLVASTPRYFSGSVHFRYFRARISTGVTGTTAGVQCHSAFRLQNYTPQMNIVNNVISTASVTSVADSASSQSLLASNSSRLGFIIFNDSTVNLYVKLGATASTTSFSYRLTPYGTISETDFPYTGAIDGIWASDAAGSARITELS